MLSFVGPSTVKVVLEGALGLGALAEVVEPGELRQQLVAAATAIMDRAGPEASPRILGP